jgi:hypothetical protein
MIPPSLLDVTYYFSWVPCWEDEPVAPTEPAPEGANPSAESGNESNTEAAPAAEQPGGDADGVNDVVAVHRVFKGYRLVAIPDYTATAFTGYTRWIESGQDEDLERGRRDERARRAVNPHPTPSQAAPEQAAPSDDAPSSTDTGD